MGVANLPDQLTGATGRTCPRGARRRPALMLAVMLAAGTSPAVAQSVLTRDFERAFFARREVWLDRLFTAAPRERREAALPLLAEALEHRGWADSLAGERCQRMARAAAVLSGLAADDPRFLDRFNFWLLALPEVVDPGKIERDRVQLGELSRRLYPLLRPVVVEDPEAPCRDRERIFLTARGVFGFAKPPALRVRFTIAQAGEERARIERGDTEDANGWQLFDLVSSLVPQATGSFLAHAGIGVDGTWPRPEDPPCAAHFVVAPGYFARFWAFLELRRQLAENATTPPPARALDRLTVLEQEATRPLLGRDYLVRAWPVAALEEAQVLARDLLAGTQPARAPRGDAVWGIRTADDRVVPLRVVWRDPGSSPRATVVLPPSGQDENWVLDGLAVPIDDLVGDGEVWAFAHFPAASGYLAAAQRLLAEEFCVTPGRTRLVGGLDGGTRARYALGLVARPLAELVIVGGDVSGVTLLDAADVARVRVVPAYGHPTAVELAGLAARGAKDRLTVDPPGPRSLAEALRRLRGD